MCLYYAVHITDDPSPIINEKSAIADRYMQMNIPTRSIRITETVNFEISKNIDRVVIGIADISNYDRFAVRRLVNKAKSRYRHLVEESILVSDEHGTHLDSVRDMYSNIWNDGDASKLDRWARIKHGPRNRGRSDIKAWNKTSAKERRKLVDLGPPKGGDLVILATATRLARGARVVLPTFDHDYIIFKDEIMGRLGVEIISGYDM